MAGYLRRLSPYRRVGGYISGGTASQPGSYPTTTSAVWSLDDLYLRRVGPLLDNYPNAAAAYSLRSLTSAYTGPVVTVRRSTDSAEADFTATEVSDGTLEAWCGAGDGLVKTLYDQSGHGRHASQTTATAQPKIVSGGVLVLENGLPAIDFDGTDDRLPNASFSVSGTVTSFAVFNPANKADFQFAYDTQPASARLRLGTWDTYKYFADTGSVTVQIAESTLALDGSQHLFFAYHGPSEARIFADGGNSDTQATTTFTSATTALILGSRNDGADHYLDGTLQELIIYPVDQSANRVAIEDNINSHYNVF